MRPTPSMKAGPTTSIRPSPSSIRYEKLTRAWTPPTPPPGSGSSTPRSPTHERPRQGARPHPACARLDAGHVGSGFVAEFHRRIHPQRRPPRHPRLDRRQCRRSAVGRQRLHAPAGRADPAWRRARRPSWTAAVAGDGGGFVRHRLARLRAQRVAGAAACRACITGHRRCHAAAQQPGLIERRLRRRSARQGDRNLGRRRSDQCRHRPAGGRVAGRAFRLAQHFLHQHPVRGGRDPRCPDPGRRG